MSNEQCEIRDPRPWSGSSHAEAAEFTEEQALNRGSPVCLSLRHEAHKGGDGPREGTELHIANCSLLICHCGEMRPDALWELPVDEQFHNCSVGRAGPFPRSPNVQCEMSNEQCEISGPLLWSRLSHTEAAEFTEVK